MKGIKKFLLTAAMVMTTFAIAGGMKAEAAGKTVNINKAKTFSSTNYNETVVSFITPKKG